MTDWIDDLAVAYATDRRAVRKAAEAQGITIRAVYYHMDKRGIERRHGGDSMKGIAARENNPNWKGGTTRRKDGYILEYVNGKQLFQHRIIMERVIGRPLKRGEIVHHIDGNKGNNDPSNLELLPSHSEHMKHHCDPSVMRERGLRGNKKRWEKFASLKARTAQK